MKATAIAEKVKTVVNNWEPVLTNLSDSVLNGPRNGQNRTVKQLLGHLIDSAANNHLRIVRLQYCDILDMPDYQQDNDRWIDIQGYQQEDWKLLIQLWKTYNLHVAHCMQQVKRSSLDHTWQNFEGNTISLSELIEGYLWHLELHLGEIRELIDS